MHLGWYSSYYRVLVSTRAVYQHCFLNHDILDIFCYFKNYYVEPFKRLGEATYLPLPTATYRGKVFGL